MTLSRFAHLSSLARPRIAEPDNVRLRLQRNEKPDSWSPDLLAEIFNSIPDVLVSRYPDPSEFQARLAQFLGVAEGQIVVTSGIDEAIRTLMLLNCGSGDRVAYATGYAMYDVYSKIFGIDPVRIEYRPGEFLTPEALCDQIPENTKVLFLPNPNQPVENCFDIGQLRFIASWCDKHGIILAVDEAYHFFGGPSAIPLTKEFDNVLVLRSFSKAFGAAGLRLGYVVAGSMQIAPLAAIRLAHEANALSLHVGLRLLDHFESHVLPAVQNICAGRDYLRNEWRGQGGQAWGEHGNFVLLKLRDAAQLKHIDSDLKSNGTYVKASTGGPLDGCLSITCGPRPMMVEVFEQLMESMKRHG
ncbi:histidinol-phosphate transaminase [Magnetospira sp. QH-2]|uniref:pyridoxal phosphate-dependent aminotransferase n=1 Tax=Magnetospira sp. (strain QH-2) TaxID=1288970 RepID=UPI0003E80DE4|nr:histidinol-phosphate transaminase [Magnetospira sp. QH-2]CCQ75498.1 putative Histidinol-phosphate aminotransferase [Magnetospira sp. QH-2]